MKYLSKVRCEFNNDITEQEINQLNNSAYGSGGSYMDAFSIKGSNGLFTITVREVFGFPDKTSMLGGYDVRGNIDIQCGSIGRYSANGELYFSTGQIYTFFNQLKHAYKTLNGEVTFINEYDKTFKVKIEFDDKGHVFISGEFQELTHESNRLFFEIDSDQTYLSASLKELESITNKFGGLTGYRK